MSRAGRRIGTGPDRERRRCRRRPRATYPGARVARAPGGPRLRRASGSSSPDEQGRSRPRSVDGAGAPRPRRDDRRDRPDAARRDARRRPGPSSTTRSRAWPRRCAPRAGRRRRSRTCRAASSASSGGRLIVNLPGSPKGAIESLDAIAPVLDHALETLAGPYDHAIRRGRLSRRCSRPSTTSRPIRWSSRSSGARSRSSRCFMVRRLRVFTAVHAGAPMSPSRDRRPRLGPHPVRLPPDHRCSAETPRRARCTTSCSWARRSCSSATSTSSPAGCSRRSSAGRSAAPSGRWRWRIQNVVAIGVLRGRSSTCSSGGWSTGRRA